MTDFKIDSFWTTFLADCTMEGEPKNVDGWARIVNGIDTFVEAPLHSTVSPGPSCGDILLVSAPGAVGKSTLAKQICSRTGAIYIDLSRAGAVGSLSLTGGLSKSGLHPGYHQVALLVDALDEARIRVTSEAFEDFLKDVANLAKSSDVQMVLFGRTATIRHSEEMLSELKCKTYLLEIGYFNEKDALQFTKEIFDSKAELKQKKHEAVFYEALDDYLSRIKKKTDKKFWGYAPVLEAIALSILGESNAVNWKPPAGDLMSIASSILMREHGKMKDAIKSRIKNSSLADQLYHPAEQLERLGNHLYNIHIPELPKLPPEMEMSSENRKIYTDALETFLEEHPFLQRNEGNDDFSPSVFDAMICCHVLKSRSQDGDSYNKFVNDLFKRGDSVNPFLFDFYFDKDNDVENCLESEHIGILYASLRGRASRNEIVSLEIMEEDVESDDEGGKLHVEFTMYNGMTGTDVIQCEGVAQAYSEVMLGGVMHEVRIEAPTHTIVEIGVGAEECIVRSPVDIESDVFIAKNKTISFYGEEPTYIFIREFSGFGGTRVINPDNCKAYSEGGTIRGPGHLGSLFSHKASQGNDPNIDEILRRLRKFVLSFRAYGKDSLARTKEKLNHERMIKGSGANVLQQLLDDGIVELKGSFYHLDQQRLADVVGLTHMNCRKQEYNETTELYAKKIASHAN